jgi:hypothetical protein
MTTPSPLSLSFQPSASVSLPMSARWLWALVWAGLTAVAGFELAKHGYVNGDTGDAVILTASAVGLFIAPDLTFLAGLGDPVSKGMMSPRAVPYYNAMHRIWLPLLLTAGIGVVFAPLGLLGLAGFIGGLSWMAHIAMDRTAGYSLRNADGSRG